MKSSNVVYSFKLAISFSAYSESPATPGQENGGIVGLASVPTSHKKLGSFVWSDLNFSIAFDTSYVVFIFATSV